MHGQQYIKIS